MKQTIVLSVVLVVALIGVAPSAAKAETGYKNYDDYFTLKGGVYYPSERFDLDEFSSTDFDRKKGYTGEIAWGHYYAPVFGTEFGVGYLQTRRFPDLGPGRTRVEAIPVLLSARLLLPVGPVEPYGEIGVGAYFSKLETEGGIGGPRSFREVDFGPHAGVGVNINFTDTFFLGVEGRYRRVKPDYDGQIVRLDGYTATVNLGFRY
jgi:opacity protein-like surface antigen